MIDGVKGAGGHVQMLIEQHFTADMNGNFDVPEQEPLVLCDT